MLEVGLGDGTGRALPPSRFPPMHMRSGGGKGCLLLGAPGRAPALALPAWGRGLCHLFFSASLRGSGRAARCDREGWAAAQVRSYLPIFRHMEGTFRSPMPGVFVAILPREPCPWRRWWKSGLTSDHNPGI